MLPLRVTEAFVYPYFIAFLLLSVIALVIKRITLFTSSQNKNSDSQSKIVRNKLTLYL